MTKLSTLRPCARIWLLGVWVVVTTASCSERTDQERCDDMASYFEGRERGLPLACDTDDDCLVVYIRPDRPFAASEDRSDPSLQRVVQEYRRQCEDIPRAGGRVFARCQDLFQDVVNEDGDVEEVPIGRTCVLQGDVVLPDVDAGHVDAGDVDGGTEDVSCECVSDAGCPGAAVCVGCACVTPGTPCASACIRAGTCGVVQEFGLGTDPGHCFALCEAAFVREPGVYDPLVQCLTAASCGDVDACLRFVP